jgi:methyl coenzyme M reductase beta subunit
VHLEACTKPHVHQKFENFGTNIASTMACPNFKNGPKTALRPLGVKHLFYVTKIYSIFITNHRYEGKLSINS